MRHDGRADQSEREANCRTICKKLRTAIEKAVPHGRTNQRQVRRPRRMAPIARRAIRTSWREAEAGLRARSSRNTRAAISEQHVNHLGTLGTGNHFIEVCLDEKRERVVHAAPRIARRRQSHRHATSSSWRRRTCAGCRSTCRTRTSRTCRRAPSTSRTTSRRWHGRRSYARANRQIMMDNVIAAIRHSGEVPPFTAHVQAINCHHNYVARERHYGEDVYVTRKGAVRARQGRPGNYSRQHGRAIVHRARQGQPGELRELQPRRGPGDVAR